MISNTGISQFAFYRGTEQKETVSNHVAEGFLSLFSQDGYICINYLPKPHPSIDGRLEILRVGDTPSQNVLYVGSFVESGADYFVFWYPYVG